ncbi:MAG: hypothetical protein K2X47_05730 [Bdellovibrionales bacterium]|nr:hypothetical protein [Bdellovibrionales bacterium]
MKRVLLVIEGFNELAYTETLLKKVGFDCTGTQNELGIAEKILSFRPQVMLATSRGRKVKGETLMERLSAKGLHLPQLILLASDQSLSEFEKSHSRAQQVLISPVSPVQLIEALAVALELDSATLIKKMGRDLDPSMVENKLEFYVKGGAGPLEENAGVANANVASGVPPISRSKRDPSAILKNLPTTPGGLDRRLVEAQTQDFRKREKDADIKEIDEERQEFVKTLFKMGSES